MVLGNSAFCCCHYSLGHSSRRREKPSAYIVRSEIGGPWTIDQLDEEGFDFLMPTMKQEIDEKFPDAVIAEIEPAPGASVARALIDYSDQLEDISCVVMGARNQRFPKKRDVPMHAGSVAATFAELSFAKSVLIVRTAPGIVVPRWETSRYPFPYACDMSSRRQVKSLSSFSKCFSQCWQAQRGCGH